MRVTFTVAAASLLVGLPSASLALGLGEIQLRSALNAPLDAQIELIGATAEELNGLRAQLASRETFTRYGLDYPSYLANIQVRFVRGNDSRPVIELRSTAPMTEPFATLLVEVNYPRGRSVREYTVLLDPPVFAPAGTQAAAPVAAPVIGEGQRSGEVARPATPAAAAPAPSPVAAAQPAASQPARPAAPVAASGGTYEVRRGDTLSRIASGIVGPEQTQQRRAMIAIYRGNPDAFDGNINLLRSGAVLRLPDSGAIDSIDAAEATAEVRRQAASWQANRPAPADADARLRLVPPGETPAATPGTGVAGTGTGAGSADLQRRVEDLERQLAESRRLLELRNAELARLQGPPAPAPAPQAAPVAPPPAAVTPEPAPAPAPAVEPAPAPAAPPSPPPPAAPAAEEDEGIVGLLTKFWYVPALAIAALLALLGLRAARRRREDNLDALGLGSSIEPGFRDTSADTLPLRKPNITGEDQARNFVVEESGTHERPAFTGGSARATQRVEVDEPTIDTPLVEQTASLDQGDPLAEADFHMAYGLYDQAADLVRLAIQREPARRDLRLKLLEVFFVWGNREQFLQTARELATTREQSQPGEWEKVVIMGKQLAPEDPLFSQAGSSGAGAAGVDLNLEGGQNRVDFDLLGEPAVEIGIDGGIDLDLGAALRDKDPTGDALQLDPGTLDFPLDDPSRGADSLAHTATTRQMAQPGLRGDDSPTVNRAAADNEGPTVEQPGLPGGETIRQKLDIAGSKYGAPDQTAELALDDLGLDLSALDDTDQPNLDDSRITRGLDAAEAPTLVAGLDEESRRMMNDARNASGDGPTMLAPAPGASPSESGTWLFDEKAFLDPSDDTNKAADNNATMAIPSLPDLPDDASPTAKLRALESNLDFNIDGLATTGRNESLPADEAGLDLDVGMPEASQTGTFAATQRLQHEDLGLPDLEPATMSEVGTKLDLARAYMDMGDPEGARSILFEVLQEGSSNQKTEAQRLLDSIPG